MCVQWNSTFNFLQALFLRIHNFANCLCKGPSFQPILVFTMPSSLSVIIASFRIKVRDVWLFLSFEYLEATVGILIGLITIFFVVSQGIRRPKERERDGVTASLWRSRNTHNIYELCHLVRAWFVAPQNNYNSDIKDRHSQTTMTTIIIKKFETLWELPKCNTETLSEQTLLKKFRRQTASTQSCHKPSIYKKHSICKVQ